MNDRRRAPAAGKRILIVSEQPGRDLLEAALGRHGYAVAPVSSEQITNAQLERLQPELVVVDVQYGEHNGLACLRTLNARPLPPVLVASNNPDLLVAIEAQPDQYACDRTLLLPVDIGELYSIVEELIGPPA